MKANAIRVHTPGGPEALGWEAVEVGEPGPGEVRVRQAAVGVNFIDVYHRRGAYPVPLPFTPGSEAAGVVDAVGPGVTAFAVGDRVAYGTGPLGAYAEARVFPADKLVPLPEGIDARTAAAAMLKGLTAQYLLRQTRPVQPGDTVVWHAAAGGVGLIGVPWAKHLGATVIGTVGSEEKAEVARAAGCAEVIVTPREDFVARVRALTGGRGADVVYDGVGRDTFAGSLDCLRPRGMLVSFGQSSGMVPPFDVLALSHKGSLYLTRPTLATYAAAPEALRAMAADLFAVIGAGVVSLHIGQTFALKDARAAHEALEGRRTVGSTVLLA